MAAWARELRVTARGLARRKGFAAAVAAVTAIAVAAVAVVFSAADAALLKPLYARGQRDLVVAWGADAEHGIPLVELSYPDAMDLRAHTPSLEQAAAFGSSNWEGVLTGAGDAMDLPFAGVSANFFDVLRLRPLLGRAFQPSDDRTAAPNVLVISETLWRERFGASPDAIGRAIVLDHHPMTIVGVMGSDATFPPGANAWVPLWPYVRDALPPDALLRLRNVGFLHLVGRLAPGRGIDACRAEMTGQIRASHAAYDGRPFGEAVVTSFNAFVLGPTRTALFMIAAAVVLLLVIAAANIAGLVLVRGAERTREMAIRTALGASGTRAALPVAVEALVLCAIGTATGLLLARLALPRLIALAPDLTDLQRAALGLRSAAAGLTAGALICAAGLGAVRLAARRRAELTAALAARVAGMPRARVLVTAEIAVTIALIVASALAWQSAANLTRLDLGYRPEHVLLLRAPTGAPATVPAQRAFGDAVADRLARLPGIAAAGAVTLTPLELGPIGDDRGVYPEGERPADPSAAPIVGYLAATPGYFDAMGIRLIRGRLFTAQDDERAAAVAVLSESAAKRLWGDRDPIGRRVVVSAGTAPLLVIGVVADGRTRRLASPTPDLYVPSVQSDTVAATWAIRITVPPASIAPAIRAAVLALDRSRAVSIERFDARIRAAERPWIATAAILGGFAAIALLLALAGVHALVAYAVSTRTREFGLRMALGATRWRIAWEVAAPLVGPLVIGTAAGLAAAAVGTSSMRALLFGVQPLDAGSYAAGAALVAAAVAGACALPALRAASTHPADALRT